MRRERHGNSSVSVTAVAALAALVILAGWLAACNGPPAATTTPPATTTSAPPSTSPEPTTTPPEATTPPPTTPPSEPPATTTAPEPPTAYAMNYVVVDTGQEQCYNNSAAIASPAPGGAFYGQDAQYAGAPPAYRDNGTGAQRSDPKTGNPADYPQGHGPQGDAVRIYNYVRCVRDA